VVNNRNRVTDADGRGPAVHVTAEIGAAGGEAACSTSSRRRGRLRRASVVEWGTVLLPNGPGLSPGQLHAPWTRVHAIMDTIWPLGFVLTAVWGLRLGFEAIGDAQLRRFRADPANAGQVLDRRLWRYTRHPNYFGDAMVWFGLWLLACSHWLGLVLVACPLYMTNMLVRHTGKRLLEKHMARSKGAAYAEYVRRTSGFIPRPPR
jgi:protein-S-isoprenylcysteine O-methyltransferase Ste14